MRDELIRYIPLEWITNYEKIHQQAMPVQASDLTFTKLLDGSVKTIFKESEISTFGSTHFIFLSMAIIPMILVMFLFTISTQMNQNPMSTILVVILYGTLITLYVIQVVNAKTIKMIMMIIQFQLP